MPELNSTALIDDANLVAYYRFSNGAFVTDTQGSYNLTNNNTVGESAGKWGNAADFGTSNADKYLSVTSDMGITGGNCSISLWVKMNAQPGVGARECFFIVQDDGVDVGNAIEYRNNGGAMEVIFNRARRGVADEEIEYNYTLTTTGFTHLVYTYDTTNVRGYINGSLIGTTAASGNGTGSTADIATVGRFADADIRYTNSIIDDLAVFNDVLTPAEVYTLYKESSAFFMNLL